MGEDLQWDADSAACIRARGGYPGSTGVELDGTQEVISGVDLRIYEEGTDDGKHD